MTSDASSDDLGQNLMLIAISMLMAIGMHADLRNQQMELIAHDEC